MSDTMMVMVPYAPQYAKGGLVDEAREVKAASRNGDTMASGKISEHALANALDVASFTLADGRTIDVFFALEMLNVGAHHEVLDDPRAPGTRDAQKII